MGNQFFQVTILTLLTAILIYAIIILYDTASGIFIILEHEKIEDPQP